MSSVFVPAAIAKWQRPLVVAAHPDDETIGAGALLHHLLTARAQVAIVHLTDGAPENGEAAGAHGFVSREAYAHARRAELRDALALLPRAPRHFMLSFSDQQLSSRLPELVTALAGLVESWRPSVVITHPYEGGHPDHDSASLAMSIVSRLVSCPPELFEFTSYHRHQRTIRTGVFLNGGEAEVLTLAVNPAAAIRKRRMLGTFATQRDTLKWFDPAAPELFRRAPSYDFRRPPHELPLFYDLFPWGTSSAEWLHRATALLDAASSWTLSCR